MEDRPPYVVLHHIESGREVPVEVRTVFGRWDTFYRYQSEDDRPDRLGDDEQIETLAGMNFIQLSTDTKVSRTHGMLDPTMPGLADLSSTNGTRVNGNALRQRSQGPGPYEKINHGDEVVVGFQRFRVEVRSDTFDDACNRAQKHRFGLIVHDGDHIPRARKVRDLLLQRKGFRDVRAVSAGQGSLTSGLFWLRKNASAQGVTVVSFHCRAEASALVIQDRPIPFSWILDRVCQIPGRTILALDIDEDPTRFAKMFAERAYEDMALVAAVGEVSFAEPEIGTDRSAMVRIAHDSICGKSGPGVLDEAIDGLDAFIPADTNILDTGWTDSYYGRLVVSLGEKERKNPGQITHSIRYGSSRFYFH